MAYLEAKDAYDAAPDTVPPPNQAGYIYLAEEAADTGMAFDDVVTLVLGMATRWRPLNAKIEGPRRGSIVRAENAATAAELQAIFPIAWPVAPPGHIDGRSSGARSSADECHSARRAPDASVPFASSVEIPW